MKNGGIWILLMHQTAVHLFAFFSLNLPQVELELLALQDVAICPATLTGSGGNAGCRGVRKFSHVRIFNHRRNKVSKMTVGLISKTPSLS